jgi:hypothetical protein
MNVVKFLPDEQRENIDKIVERSIRIGFCRSCRQEQGIFIGFERPAVERRSTSFLLDDQQAVPVVIKPLAPAAANQGILPQHARFVPYLPGLGQSLQSGGFSASAADFWARLMESLDNSDKSSPNLARRWLSSRFLRSRKTGRVSAMASSSLRYVFSAC